MIEVQNGIFGLHGKDFSCLLRVNDYGLLEQLHFGPAVQTADAPAFFCRSGLGWGESVLLKEGDTASCPDVLPLAFSVPGRGDYRESPIELAGSPADLRYHSHRILEGELSMESGLPQAHGAQQTLVITLAQEGLELELCFSLFPDALTRRCILKNTSDRPLVLTKLMSMMVDLPGDYEMTTFDGGWIAEMRKHRLPVLDSRVVNESTTGFSSHRHNPGFLLSAPGATEDSGPVYGFNLVYSGNHYASAQRSLQGLTRVMQGIGPSSFAKTLAPGRIFETPEAVLCYSDRGFGGLSERMHRFVQAHIIPPYWRERPRPVLYNSWEGCMFDFNRRRLLSLASQAKKLGCELFVLDDGWFGARNSDTAGLGDYNVNLKKLPGGLKKLSEKIKALGMDFGLWFEPESVNPDSDLYRSHPDWALTDQFEPLLGRNQLLLDLSREEVQDYLVENVSKILDQAEISYVKWDMNRHSVALGAKAHDYILGLYRVLERIFRPRPQILLESCSSGGNRFDLGMLCYGPQIWCSDNTDPIERLTIQENLSYLYPQSTFGAHVSASPHAQTLRATPLCTRGNVSFFGCLGYELDLDHLLKIERQEIQAQIEFYKLHRMAFQFGTFRRLKKGWQVSREGITLAAVFRRLVAAAPAWERLELKGLDRNKRYRLRSRPQRLRIGQFGSLVKHVAPVNLDPNGFVLRTADRHFTLPDGAQELCASGSALMAGTVLLPLFRGTGYDQNQRTLTDFGSELFIIEEEPNHAEPG
ncbi:MAG: alpha-galactosidase [Oscillospiraceae bacterium]|nr:alpha-galactosidase [Oscillospiraceae bacterium]